MEEEKKDQALSSKSFGAFIEVKNYTLVVPRLIENQIMKCSSPQQRGWILMLSLRSENISTVIGVILICLRFLIKM